MQQNNTIQEIKIGEGWRGFDVPPADYKLENEVKPVVDQSFLHNLNSRINQVNKSGNSLVPMPHPPSGTRPTPPFVITYDRTTRQYFGRKCIRQQRLEIAYLLPLLTGGHTMVLSTIKNIIVSLDSLARLY